MTKLNAAPPRSVNHSLLFVMKNVDRLARWSPSRRQIALLSAQPGTMATANSQPRDARAACTHSERGARLDFRGPIRRVFELQRGSGGFTADCDGSGIVHVKSHAPQS